MAMVTMKLVDSYRNVTSSISSTVSSSMADQWVTVANVGADKGANLGAKILSLVAGLAVGADSINDMDLLRRGGCDWVRFAGFRFTPLLGVAVAP